MKKKIRNDIILVTALLIAAVLAWFVIRFINHPGNTVVVSINGTDVASYPLNEDRKAEFITDDGHVNTLCISEGRAYMLSADCPDKLCVKHGSIYLTGQTIVCLPHRLVVKIEGKGGVDAG